MAEIIFTSHHILSHLNKLNPKGKYHCLCSNERELLDVLLSAHCKLGQCVNASKAKS